MELETNSINWAVCCLSHCFDHVVNGISLGLLPTSSTLSVIIVVEEASCGVTITSPLENLTDDIINAGISVISHSTVTI